VAQGSQRFAHVTERSMMQDGRARVGSIAVRAVVTVCASALGWLACGTSGKDGFQPPATTPDFDASADAPFQGCGTVTYQGRQSPAALLVVLDASGTMAANNKYAFAEQALISAIDQDAFDAVALGLLLYPTGTVAGPACTLGLPVTCKVSGLAQVPLILAGAQKSNASTGVRHDIYAELARSEPNKTGVGDGNPSFDALTLGISALKSYPFDGKRILLYITDGGASCTSLSTRTGYTDANGCNDWEHPDELVTLLAKAHADTKAPVSTFVVGVPGADTTGADPATQPPYHVRNALSAYAFAGSPETVDPTCTGKAYTQNGADPQVSCHFDMTQQYSAQMLADAINQIRGKVLGCVFELPAPEAGTLDRGLVNVQVATGGGAPQAIYRRKDTANTCAADGCWDYTADGKLELFGKSCSDVKAAADARVEIVVGCGTVVK
jgi:hypothetical protein